MFVSRRKTFFSLELQNNFSPNTIQELIYTLQNNACNTKTIIFNLSSTLVIWLEIGSKLSDRSGGIVYSYVYFHRAC